MPTNSKLASLAEAIRRIQDGACVALGGSGGRRPPMALIREIIRQGRKDLRLICWDHSPAYELLAAAGCSRSISAGNVETRNRIRAAAFGLLSSSGTWDALFTASRPDFVLLHAQWADLSGNVRFAVDQWDPEFPDLLLARTGAKVIVSVEQVVSDQTIRRRPTDPFLSSDAVDCVVEAPYGAYPAACETRYETDPDALAELANAVRSQSGLTALLNTQVFGMQDHWSLLDQIGSRRLLGSTIDRLQRV